MILILHETPAARYSLIPGDRISSGSKVVELNLGEIKMIGISKSKKVLTPQKDVGQCYEYGTENSREKCYVKEVMADIYNDFDKIKDNCQRRGWKINQVCAIPQALQAIKFSKNGTNLPLCTTKDEYNCMLNTLFTDASKRDEKCTKPCTESKIDTITKGIPQDMKEWAMAMMYYVSDDIIVQEEYLVFDFNSIVIAAGGSLGLFVGFSFLQMADVLIDSVKKVLKCE